MASSGEGMAADDDIELEPPPRILRLWMLLIPPVFLPAGFLAVNFFVLSMLPVPDTEKLFLRIYDLLTLGVLPAELGAAISRRIFSKKAGFADPAAYVTFQRLSAGIAVALLLFLPVIIIFQGFNIFAVFVGFGKSLSGQPIWILGICLAATARVYFLLIKYYGQLLEKYGSV
jgi:hypothetical protein